MPALCTKQESRDLEAHMTGAAVETALCLLSYRPKSHRSKWPLGGRVVEADRHAGPEMEDVL